MEIKLSIKDKYAATFLAFLKTLDYITIKEGFNTEGGILSSVQEPAAIYGKKNKLSADEIEQLIIAKALSDARKIERGELELRTFNSSKELIADLEAQLNEEE